MEEWLTIASPISANRKTPAHHWNDDQPSGRLKTWRSRSLPLQGCFADVDRADVPVKSLDPACVQLLGFCLGQWGPAMPDPEGLLLFLSLG